MGARTSAERPSVDIVVVTYNPGDTIGAFLDSVAAQRDVDAHVVVVDSASADSVAEEAARSRRVPFVAMRENRGYGAAVNEGARLGSAPLLVAANSDIVLEQGALLALARSFEDARVGSAGPRILERDGTLYPSARPLPGIVLGAGHAALGRVWPRNPFTRRYRASLDPHAGAVDVGWLSGSFVMVRRGAWADVVGFDEGFFMFMEDVDLGRRLGLAGYANRWVPDAVVTHVGGHSWRRDPAPMIRAHHESAERYVRRAYPGWHRAPARWAARAGLRLRARAEVAAASRPGAD